MACIRGVKGKCPCPICLCPSMELWEITKTHPRRTAQGVQAIIKRKGLNKGQMEELCKQQGLRAVEVNPLICSFCDVKHI